jgi:hypothetical protein
MFHRYETRRRKAERIAGQAWDQLSAAVESAESSTRRQYADTSKKISNSTKEARKRAARAYAALAGRRQRTPWQWLAAATLVGAAAGWVATTVTRRAMNGQDDMSLPASLADEYAAPRS